MPLPIPLFLPVVKVIALGSVKFIILGIGACLLPVHTANFLVGMSASTPMKYAEFRFRNGTFTQEEIEQLRSAFAILNHSITDPNHHLSRSESRAFLWEVMKQTLQGMRQNVRLLYRAITRKSRRCSRYLSRRLPFDANRKR